MADTKLLVASLLLLSPVRSFAENGRIPSLSREFIGVMRAVNTQPRPQAFRTSSSWTQFNEAIAKTRPAVVMVVSEVGAGAGFIVSQQGSVVTSAELVEGAGLEGEVGIITSTGRQLKGRVRSVNTNLNVARVQIEADDQDWPVVSIGGAANSPVGYTVAILGCPFDSLTAVSFASIEAHQNGFLYFRGSAQYEARAPSARLVATTPFNKVSELCRGEMARSGAAIIDTHGQVIGVSQAIESKAGFSHGPVAALDTQNLIAFLASQNMEHDRRTVTYNCPEIDMHNIEKVRLSNGLHGGPVWVEHSGDAPPAAIADKYFSYPLAAEPSIEHMIKNGNDTPWWFVSNWRGDRHRDKIKDAACFLRGAVAFYLWGNEDPREQTPGSIKVPYEVRPGPDGAQERANPEFARRLIEMRWFEHDGTVNPATGKPMGRFHRWFNMKMGREMEWFKMGTDPNTRQEIIDETFRPIPAGHAVNDLY